MLANPKTCINDKYAPKQIKDCVIRADQLIAFIKKKDEASKDKKMSNDEMLELAKFYLEKNIPERSDYARKYEELINEFKDDNATNAGENVSVTASVEMPEAIRAEIIKELKEFRLKQSRAENIKPYYILNDLQMNDLLEKMPCTKEQLLNVSGFGKAKAEKYGEAILAILQKNQ